jgi:hypothetical protein
MEVHSNFRSILVDFTTDLTNTFPEYSHLWSKWSTPSSFSDTELQTVFDYCLAILPERFFDILYQNEEMFKPESNINTFFLPEVDFKALYNCSGISDKTRQYIWKYLQVILFTVVGEVKDKSNFGESLNMFEGIDENDLQGKMKETMEGITDFFKTIIQEDKPADADNKMGGEGDQTDEKEKGGGGGGESFKEEFKNMFGNMPKFPNMENIQDHLKSLFEGKIGTLAKEMAEEISGEFSDILGEDINDVRSTQDVIQKLMKNPKKIMDLMKTVGSKLDQKMKSGEISREEIMKEAGDLFGKMKGMGGQDQFNDMFKNLAKGMGGLGKNMKLDTNAINRMTKMQETRERIRKKVELKKQMEEITKQQLELQKKAALANYMLHNTDNPNNFKFSLDGEEQQEKSFIHPDILKEMEVEAEDEKKKNTATEGAKKKKNKKKKKN